MDAAVGGSILTAVRQIADRIPAVDRTRGTREMQLLRRSCIRHTLQREASFHLTAGVQTALICLHFDACSNLRLLSSNSNNSDFAILAISSSLFSALDRCVVLF